MNVTPDSFSDGGELSTIEAVVARATRLAQEGADALDIGGESTRPGAAAVSEATQIARVVPAIKAIRVAGITLPITIDTTRAAVADAALEAGANAVNDVSASTDDPAMLPLIARRNVGVILMHRLTLPSRDSYSTQYTQAPTYEGGVVAAVRAALAISAQNANEAGVDQRSILVDPGLGFGKSVQDNEALLRSAGTFADLAAGVLIGASRKSFLAATTPAEPAMRDDASVTAATVALAAGARCLRVHSVRAHRNALDTSDLALGNKSPCSES